jgi:cytochrome c biogenesis protein CcmG/thiol:disulfide interchange protein DsbE
MRRTDRFHRKATLALLALTLAAGCDRGQHPGQIGSVAPQFALSDGVASADLGKLRGRIVILNFWATWCPPCVEELPSLMELQRRMPQVTVLAISTDEDDQIYRQFLIDHHVALATVRDGAQHANALYGSFRYPETYIIDRQGILRRKFIGPQNWTSPEILEYLSRL